MTSETEMRKLEHIKICCEESVQSDKTTLLEFVELKKSAPLLPESDLDLSVELFGKKLNYPLIISGMTGGAAETGKINKNLAQAAEELGIGFGVGSQRAMLEDPSLKSTYDVRDVAPNVLLIGNIGAPQLSEYSSSAIEKMAMDIGSDVLAVHLNSAQEMIQPEGIVPKMDYSEKVSELCSSVSIPVILKETGTGISQKNANSFRNSGLSGIDVGGAGGTSFARVELERMKSPALMDFEDFGTPTAASILDVRKVFPTLPVIATGGIRTGDDVAKAIALGANSAGIALPLLKPAQASSDAVKSYLQRVISELKKSMMALSAPRISDLNREKIFITGELIKWL
ncbi:MAG: type 2 isopentenyl-diphosphate Delta-isomerase [archaeon]